MQIYLITNTVTGQNYVGQTRWDFNTRYQGGNWHKWTHNKHLRNAAAKYGTDSFRITILKEGEFTLEELTRMEDQYIKEHNAMHPHGYNWRDPGKGGHNYYNHKEYELKDAYGNVYQVINLSRFCKQNRLKYGGLLNVVCGVATSSQGYALSNTPIEDIIDINETWEIEEIATGKLFGVKWEGKGRVVEGAVIDTDSLGHLVNGTTKTARGFRMKGSDATGETVKYRGVELVHDDGREVVIDSAYRFAEEEGVERGALYDVFNGRCLHAKGWRLKSVPDRKLARLKRLGITVELRSVATGEVIEVKNVSQFCREHGLDIDRMHNMVHGSSVAYAGWTLPIPCGRKPRKEAVYIRLIHESGRVVEGTTPRDIERRFGIMTSVSIGCLIRGKSQSVKGWRVTNVRYLNDSYPEIVR